MTPRILIGLPVFNGESSVARAIKSVCDQTFTDFRLVIADNASTDRTYQICQEFAARDPRIHLLRRETNIGALPNYRLLLSEAKSPLFLFLAADDWLESHYLEHTVRMIDQTPSAVACSGTVLVHHPDGRIRRAYGTHSITGPSWLRCARFLIRPADNSRFYGLHRTKSLQLAFAEGETLHAHDWLISTLSLEQGTHVQAANAVLHRSGGKPGRYVHGADQRHPRSSVAFWLPGWPMTTKLLRSLKPAHRIAAVLPLLTLNVGLALEAIYFRSARRG